jgi:dihydrofolate reductase
MADTPLVHVVAVAENGVIGAKGGLPWRAKADLRKFRAVTMGKPLVMGRKTYESIGRPLDGRDNIVVSRQADFRPEGVIVASSLDEALAIADEHAKARGVDEICVIGGGEIFADTLASASRLHVTHIGALREGDTVFPEISPTEWSEVSREPLPSSEGDDVEAVYVVYEKRG